MSQVLPIPVELNSGLRYYRPPYSLTSPLCKEIKIWLEVLDEPKSNLSCRAIHLDAREISCVIGRSSSRSETYRQSTNNAYFSNPIISRKHALIVGKFADKSVFIRDTDSLHGTYLNHIRLTPYSAYMLHDRDLLSLGVQLSHGEINPCTLRVRISYIQADGSYDASVGMGEQEVNQYLGIVHHSPNVFRVPDDSDEESEASDGQDTDELQGEQDADEQQGLETEYHYGEETEYHYGEETEYQDGLESDEYREGEKQVREDIHEDANEHQESVHEPMQTNAANMDEDHTHKDQLQASPNASSLPSNDYGKENAPVLNTPVSDPRAEFARLFGNRPITMATLRDPRYHRLHAAISNSETAPSGRLADFHSYFVERDWSPQEYAAAEADLAQIVPVISRLCQGKVSLDQADSVDAAEVVVSEIQAGGDVQTGGGVQAVEDVVDVTAVASVDATADTKVATVETVCAIEPDTHHEQVVTGPEDSGVVGLSVPAAAETKSNTTPADLGKPSHGQNDPSIENSEIPQAPPKDTSFVLRNDAVSSWGPAVAGPGEFSGVYIPSDAVSNAHSHNPWSERVQCTPPVETFQNTFTSDVYGAKYDNGWEGEDSYESAADAASPTSSERVYQMINTEGQVDIADLEDSDSPMSMENDVCEDSMAGSVTSDLECDTELPADLGLSDVEEDAYLTKFTTAEDGISDRDGDATIEETVLVEDIMEPEQTTEVEEPMSPLSSWIEAAQKNWESRKRVVTGSRSGSSMRLDSLLNAEPALASGVLPETTLPDQPTHAEPPDAESTSPVEPLFSSDANLTSDTTLSSTLCSGPSLGPTPSDPLSSDPLCAPTHLHGSTTQPRLKRSREEMEAHVDTDLVDPKDQLPKAKRTKKHHRQRVAAAAGYFALGTTVTGAAILAMMIATAPALT